MPEILASLTIPDGELKFITARSGGPGGQNVNKVETKVTVEFDVARSPSLSDEQRARVFEKLKTRVTTDGVLQVTSQKFRTQAANRDAAVARFVELLQDALTEEKPRKKTRVPRGAKEKRLQLKKAASEKKRARSAKFV